MLRIDSAPHRIVCRGHPRRLRLRTRAVSSRHVDLAHRLADAAGHITRKAFRCRRSLNGKTRMVTCSKCRQPISVVDKDDQSPVTHIDRQVEQTLRGMIRETFPRHSVYGEEFGMDIGTGDEKHDLWVIDPIDGTLSFITGKPLFGTLISLLHHGRPILGVIDQSVLQDRWIGVEGQPTLFNGRPVQTRKCTSLSAAYVASTTPDMFKGKRAAPYGALQSTVKSHLYGSDCYAYGLLSMGMLDIVFEADMKVFDYMAMVPIVEGAGGVITDWSGQALRWDGVESDGAPSWATETLAVGDPALHNDVIKCIAVAGE